MAASLGALMVLATWFCCYASPAPQGLRGVSPQNVFEFVSTTTTTATITTSTSSTSTTTDFDEHMLAPEVDYMNKTAQFRIFPNPELGNEGTWVRLRFSKIREVDSSGNPVPGRVINSLAGQRDLVWSQAGEVIGGGEAVVTTFNLTLSFGGKFPETCGSADRRMLWGSWGGWSTFSRRRRRREETDEEEEEGGSSDSSSGSSEEEVVEAGAMSVAIKVMVFKEAATIYYGNQTFDVSPSQLKFNIESENWPFCDESNSLQFVLNIKTATNTDDDDDEADDAVAEADYQSDEEDTAAVRRLGWWSQKQWLKRMERRAYLNNEYLTSRTSSPAGDANVSMDFPEIALIDDVENDCDVQIKEGEGTSTNVVFTFPHFTESLVYDPLVEYQGFVFVSTSTFTTSSTVTSSTTSSSTTTAVTTTTAASTSSLGSPTTPSDDTQAQVGTTTSVAKEEEVVDRHMLAPEVDFLGKSAKFKIFPHGDLGSSSTWVQLTFKKIGELDSSGNKVQGRVINSLAGQKDLVWGQANESVGGAAALVTTMNLTLSFGGNFKESCDNRRMLWSFSRRRRRRRWDDDEEDDNSNDGGEGEEEDLPMMITIRVIIFKEAATITYGNETFDVAPSQLKFNIESEGWPFCDESHSLEFTMTVKTPGSSDDDDDDEDAEGDYQTDNEDDDRRLDQSSTSWKSRTEDRGKLNNRYLESSAGETNITIDMPEIAIIDDVATACDVETSTKGPTSTVVFTFPYFSDTLIYDPLLEFNSEDDESSTTVATTTEYMAATTTTEQPATTTTEQPATTTEDVTATTTKQEQQVEATSTTAEIVATTEDLTTPAGATTTTMMEEEEEEEDETTTVEEAVTTTAARRRQRRYVRGRFSLRLGQGMSGRGFCSDSNVMRSLRKTMAGRCGVLSSLVQIICSFSGRRLEEEEYPRYLADDEESVGVSYSVSVGNEDATDTPDSTPTVATDDIIEAMNTLDTDELTDLVQEDLTEAGINVTISVSSIDETAELLVVEVDDGSTSTTSSTTTTTSEESDTDIKLDSDSAWGSSISSVLCVLVLALNLPRTANV